MLLHMCLKWDLAVKASNIRQVPFDFVFVLVSLLAKVKLVCSFIFKVVSFSNV